MPTTTSYDYSRTHNRPTVAAHALDVFLNLVATCWTWGCDTDSPDFPAYWIGQTEGLESGRDAHRRFNLTRYAAGLAPALRPAVEPYTPDPDPPTITASQRSRATIVATCAATQSNLAALLLSRSPTTWTPDHLICATLAEDDVDLVATLAPGPGTWYVRAAGAGFNSAAGLWILSPTTAGPFLIR